MISLIHIYVCSIYLNESHNINFENTVFNYLKNAVFFQCLIFLYLPTNVGNTKTEQK